MKEMHRITVRKAEIKDIKCIMPLLNEVALLHGEKRNDIFKACPKHRTKKDLKRHIYSKKHFVLVAVIDNCIGGVMMCTLRTIEDDIKFKNCKILSLEDTCISEKYRRYGCASALVKEAHLIANAHNCARIEANVWSFNIPAIKQLETNGFTLQRMVLEYTLG